MEHRSTMVRCFCHKCGTKTVYEGTASKTPDTHTAEPQPETPTASSKVSNGNDFKAFEDSHVRATTQFQSAEELLGSKVPLNFIKPCFGIPVLLGLFALVTGGIGAAVSVCALTLMIGYLVVLFLAWLEKSNGAYLFLSSR